MIDNPNLEEIIINIDEARRLSAGNESVKIAAVICGSEADRCNWGRRLKEISGYIFNKDNSTLAVSLREKIGNKTREGNFLGTLLAYSQIKQLAEEKKVPYREFVTLMGMLFGRGERISPITMTEGNCKPAINVTPKSFKIGKRKQALTAMEEALLYFTPVAKFLERRGFRGILNKWGDETEIASIDLTNIPTTEAKFGLYDLIKVVSVSEVTEELAKQKDWVVFDEEYTVVGQVYRGEKETIINQLTKLGIKPDKDGKYHGGISLGPVATSYDMLDVACEVFDEEIKKEGVFFDFDPYFVMALAMDREHISAWQKKVKANEKLKELIKMVPDFFERVQKLKEKFKEIYGRELNIKVLDLGENVYWADIGQHRAMRRKYLSLNASTSEGLIARKLAGIPEERDADGSIIMDSELSSEVIVKNSIIAGSRITGRGKIEDSVIIDTKFDDVDMIKSFAVESARLGKTILKENSGIYGSFGCGDLTLGDRMRHVSIFTGKERIDLEVSEDTDLRDKGNTYNVPILNNKISFDKAYKLMMGASMEELSDRRDHEMEKIERVKERSKQFKPLRFGTSGLRDKVEFMTDMECYINTRGFICFLEEKKEISDGGEIAVGGDRRGSTPRIMRAVEKAVNTAGYKAVLCGKVPSPTLANYAMTKGIPSLMVTGSHIPDDRNGIKFTKTTGEVLKTDEADILRNVALAREEEYSKDRAVSLFDDKGMLKDTAEKNISSAENKAIEMYVERYKDFFPSDILKEKKIVLYQHSAVGRDIIKEVLEALGAEVTAVGRSETFVPVDTEKVSQETKDMLKEWAEEYKPFAIVSTDGDSDRPLLADENGEFLPGDKLGALVSIFLDPTFAAVPVSSNDAVTQALENKGVTVKQTKIGSPYVVAAMNEEIKTNPEAMVVSWESNGGFLLGSDWEMNGRALRSLPTRDAVLPLAAVLALAVKNNKTVSELISSNLPHRYTHADVVDDKTKGAEAYTADMGKEIIKRFSPSDKKITQIDFKTGEADQELKSIKQMLEKYFTKKRGFDPVTSINFIDGIRISFEGNDVAHLRPSGNAPEFRMYATADSQERADQIVETRLEIIPEIVKDLTFAGPKSLGAAASGTEIYEAVKSGHPIYILPYKQPKVWGIKGIGEYWYGAESGEKSSEAVTNGYNAMMVDVLENVTDELLGMKVAKRFGKTLPLVKILTPKGRLSVQFHDSKNELWIVTGIDRSVTEKDAEIILGFSAEALEKYGSNILAEYKKALEMYGKALNLLINELEKVDGGLKVLEEKKDAILAAEHIGKDDLKIKELLGEMKGLNKELDRFYGYHKVTIGDVIPVSSGTLHALGPGVEVVEPQIAGPTQSLEDGATYPVRYYFPGYKREGAQKKLDLDRISEMTVSPVREAAPEIVKDAGGYKIERLSGGFEDKGLEVNRITLEKGTEMDFEGILSFHNLVSLEGEAGVITAGKEVDIPKAVPGGKMLIVPASAGEFKIKAHTKCLIIDTFSPV